MRNITNLSTLIVIFILCSCHNNKNHENAVPTSYSSAENVPLINYYVVNSFKHDTTLFTEGLVFHESKLYESSGAPSELPYTNSVIGVDQLQNGLFKKKISIDKQKYFGEGIVFLGNRLYQLTYLNHIGFIYDAKSYDKIGKFDYPNQGWGLTTDGKYLIMSNGSQYISYLDTKDLKPIKVVSVTNEGFPQDSLNELEFINGYIYANIWQSNYIVKISPSNGKVIGKIDLSSVVAEAKMRNPNADVLNGIAFDSLQDKIYITGKLWQNIYEIKFPH